MTLIALALGFVWCGYAFFRTNYTVFVFCLTGYVVCLLAIAGLPERAAATYRAETTAFGGMLALLVYSAWPTWEGAHVRDRLADLLDAHRRYVAVLFGGVDRRIEAAIAHASTAPAARRGWRDRMRRRRCSGCSASQRRVDRSTRTRPSSVLATTRRHALAALALQARIEREDNPPRPELEPLAKQIDETFRALAHALRTGTPPRDLPPLRATQEALRTVTSSSIVDETDVIVDSLNTIAQMLESRRYTKARLGPRPFLVPDRATELR